MEESLVVEREYISVNTGIDVRIENSRLYFSFSFSLSFIFLI